MKLKNRIPVTFFIPEIWVCMVRMRCIKSICLLCICKVTKKKETEKRRGNVEIGKCENVKMKELRRLKH
jgi:hypothetical protein